MVQFTTPQGRVIRLVELTIAATYERFLEGSPESISRSYLENPTRYFNKPNWLPVFVILPDVFPLPSRMCLARFVSDRGVKTDDPDFNSRLAVRWFVDTTVFDQSVNDLIKAILPLFDWEQHAEDWDFTNW